MTPVRISSRPRRRRPPGARVCATAAPAAPRAGSARPAGRPRRGPVSAGAPAPAPPAAPRAGPPRPGQPAPHPGQLAAGRAGRRSAARRRPGRRPRAATAAKRTEGGPVDGPGHRHPGGGHLRLPAHRIPAGARRSATCSASRSLSDAYNYANGIPNIIYDLLLGGILSATLIPVFVEQLRGEDRAENMRGISAMVTAIVAALAAITALLWLLAPLIIHFYLLLNPAATGTAERALATRLLHFFAPQVFFLGAIVVSTALLNARRNFTAAAFSPVANNLIAIGALLGTKAVASRDPHRQDQQSRRPSCSASLTTSTPSGCSASAPPLGYVVQLLVQLPAMHRVGFRLRPVWDLRHPAVRRVAQLSTWLIGVVVANQIALALVMILAGKVQGGVTAYQFSYQFFQLPYALIVVSIATALMPDLAERWTAGDRRGFERQFVTGLRVALAVIMPVGLRLRRHRPALHSSGRRSRPGHRVRRPSGRRPAWPSSPPACRASAPSSC